MPLKLFLRGNIWHYRGTVAGRRLRGSTGVSRQNKETAQHVIADLETRAWQGRLNGPGSILTFAQAALVYRAAGKPTRFLARVEDFWKDTPVKEITAGRIRSSCMALYPVAKGATWNRAVIAPTQAIINHAAEQELCPQITVKRWPVPKTTRQAASWEWVAAFSSASTPRMAALAFFMFLTGARISEACGLRWTDLNLQKQCALIRQTKTNSDRWTHLPPDLVAALANLSGERHPDAKVFGMDRHSAWRQWKHTIERAGIEYLSPHSCRHGFATGLLQAGIDPVTVAKLGGWKGVAQIWATYGHAREDRTLTDLLTRREHSASGNGTQALENKRKSG
jgi:integrase